MINPADIALLQQHIPATEQEADHLRKILAYSQTPDSALLRENQAGHFTASAWILDQAGEKALLLDHKKLKRWLQPGGHVDPEDETFFDAAKRETAEEAGLRDLIALSPAPFDVDAHTIPARPGEPEHTHYDIRYLFQLPQHFNASDTQINVESKGYQWVPLETVSAPGSDESLARMARKSLALVHKNNASTNRARSAAP